LFAVVLSWVAVGIFGTAAGYLSALQAGVLVAVTLLAGSWADRRGQMAVMIGADLARAGVLLIAVAVWLAAGRPPGLGLVACVVVLAGGMALFRPALQTCLPHLARDPDLLPAANALLDTTDRIARLLGPGLVGLTASLFPLVHFVTLDAFSFLLSAAAVATIARLRPAAPMVPRRESAVSAVRRGFAAVRGHRLLFFVLCVSGVINGAWTAAYFLGLPLMIAQAGVTGPGGTGLAAYGLVISAYGSTNLLGTLVVGNRAMPRHPARLIFAGNCLGGLGVLLLGAAGLLLPPACLLTAFCAAAAIGAVGGPMQDIMVATLRQTELPRADIAAAIRAFILVNNLGLLVTLTVAPVLFDAIGVAAAVLLCGVAYGGAGVAGLLRFGGRE
jgi:DHA3 family macrolide efflux protein-like MFS transporter